MQENSQLSRLQLAVTSSIVNFTELVTFILADCSMILVQFSKGHDGYSNAAFYQPWSVMQQGFNDSYGNYWIGLDRLHNLTSTGNYTLLINLWGTGWELFTVQYSTFTVGNASSKYVLHQGGYNGTVGDCLAYNEGMKFCTYDDDATAICADYDDGSWWYSTNYYPCTTAGLNNYKSYGDGFVWSCGSLGNKELFQSEMWLLCP